MNHTHKRKQNEDTYGIKIWYVQVLGIYIEHRTDIKFDDFKLYMSLLISIVKVYIQPYLIHFEKGNTGYHGSASIGYTESLQAQKSW